MKCKFVVAIVSHGHYDFIALNESLKKIALLSEVEIIIKDNLGQSQLELFTRENNMTYLNCDNSKGFGENNNEIYEYANSIGLLDPDDWFLVVNPDVYIELEYFQLLINQLTDANKHFYAPSLFRDEQYSLHENSLRHFAKVTDLLNPLLLKPINKAYKKDTLENEAVIDWGSGAFLCIRSEKFDQAGGFDKRYFMYFEDVDLCQRLKENGVHLRYLKGVKAVHQGQYKNRRLFSKHFVWYVSSLLMFLFAKRRKH